MSDYYCVCDPVEGDLWIQLTDEWRVARKEHKCCECDEPIRFGELYNYTSGAFEGRVEAYKTCAFCHKERTHLQAETGFIVCFGDLACCLVAHLRGEL